MICKNLYVNKLLYCYISYCEGNFEVCGIGFLMLF